MKRLLASLTRADNIIINTLAVALVVAIGFFTLRSPYFFTWPNARVILSTTAVLGVVAVGLTMLIIAGKADLSIGASIGLSSTMTSLAAAEWHWNAFAAIALGVGCGAIVGGINGLLCGTFGLNPVIVTLGMMTSVKGVTQIIRQNPVNGLGNVFGTINNGSVLGFPVITLFSVATFLVGAVFLALTPWGRHTYAVGTNAQASFLSALPVRALPFGLYLATGAASGLAGVLWASRLDGTDPGSAGANLEFKALTVVLLGGVAFAGGRGKIVGVALAVAFLGVLDNGLVILNVNQHIQEVVQGVALITAAGLDVGGARIATRLQFERSVRGRVAGAEGNAVAATAPEG